MKAATTVTAMAARAGRSRLRLMCSKAADVDFGLVDCTKVYAKEDRYGGVGVFAAEPIAKGGMIERGIVRRVPVDGHMCPYVFTWSDDGTVWAVGSGLSMFYNTSLDRPNNAEMKRHLESDSFEILALRDISKHEEITHLYKSIMWRQCFKPMREFMKKS
eukprot:gnl/TRDRNA2_/TRDRNA2_72427_c0_seq1.p1 gnl/TRDRNA2_/TRDRNA2_72427_c0~~gnl/TRDRNA2_/TRDRNA2_72427_c0_seq1.p1  ORF type:complete len:160 (+),score=25.08 gnl/TRDRNA2_/TRDRNA2_72427_c0_seq1:77-556(+)